MRPSFYENVYYGRLRLVSLSGPLKEKHMARTVSKSRFKPRALKFFREVEQTGKEIIITDRGKPVLKVVPYTEKPEIWLKSLRGTVKRYKNPMQDALRREEISRRSMRRVLLTVNDRLGRCFS